MTCFVQPTVHSSKIFSLQRDKTETVWIFILVKLEPENVSCFDWELSTDKKSCWLILTYVSLFSSPSCSAPQFSLFGSRSTTRTTNAPSSSSSSSSPVIPSAPALKRLDRVSSCGAPNLSKAEFLECVRRSNQACQQGEYALAVRLYSEALTADPQNCILYSNRSAAYLRLGQYNTALDDAIKARLINPKWPKVRGLSPRCSISMITIPEYHIPDFWSSEWEWMCWKCFSVSNHLIRLKTKTLKKTLDCFQILRQN